MKLLKTFYLLLFFNVGIYSQEYHAQTQADMNDEARQEFKNQDNELNRVYKEILNSYQDDGQFIKKLKAAQKAWLVFRDAHVSALFPEEPDYYGSSYQMCYSYAMAQITKNRTEELQVWLNGIEEGDVCAGSVR